MKYLSRKALTARIDAAVAEAKGEGIPKLGGFSLRSARPALERAAVTDEDQERVRAALGDDAAGARILRYTLSTEKRQADSLALSMGGAKLDRYARNPVVLEGHRYWSRSPIGHSVVWADNASDTGARLRGLVAMLGLDLSQSLDRGFSYALGELHALRGGAASIGFDVLAAHPAPPEARAVDPWAMDVDEWELIEWSLVTIPMDPEAVTEGRAAGIDVGPLADGFSRLLDDLTDAGVDREKLERAWMAAAQNRGLVFAPTPAPPTPTPTPATEDTAPVTADSIREAIRAAAGQLLQG